MKAENHDNQLPHSDHRSHAASAESQVIPNSLWRRWMAWSGSFFILSLLLHIVLIAAATLLVVQVVQGRKEKMKFTAPPPSPPAAEHKVKHSKKASAAAPAVTKRITSTAANAKIALPSIEMSSSMPDVMSSVMSGMGAEGLGSGVAGGAGMAMPLSGLTVFGFRGGKQGLVGTFYDLKQTSDGKPTDMAETPVEVATGPAGMDPKWQNSNPMHRYVSVLKDFVGSWDPSVLSQYFKAPEKVTAYQIMIPYMQASEAPKVFNVEKLCKPRRWIVHYKGSFRPTKDGEFRFIGFADDMLFVRINRNNVLDSCFPAEELQLDARVREDVGPGPITPLRAGRWFTLRAGEKTDMEAIIGEGPGGDFGVFLMIQEKDVQYPLGDYPVFQLKDIPLPENMHPGRGVKAGTIPANFSGKKMLFPGS